MQLTVGVSPAHTSSYVSPLHGRTMRVVLRDRQWAQHPVEPAHCLEDVARKPSHVLFARGLETVSIAAAAFEYR